MFKDLSKILMQKKIEFIQLKMMNYYVNVNLSRFLLINYKHLLIIF